MPYPQACVRALHGTPNFRLRAVGAAVLACFSTAALAQNTPPNGHTAELPPVVVTGNPLGSGLFDLVSPTSVMSQREISERGASTLGDTLSGTPGVSSSSFGPNASRPVIRGLDADRVKITQNGVGTLDASALSPDHAVPIDPLAIEQIEVVRGPAALLYGGSAIGGVVNAIDNRIPQDAIDGVSGRGELRYGGADKQGSGSALLEAGNGTLALHADAFQRSTRDLSIPGYARSARLRAQSPQATEARDHLPNSAAHTDGGALGTSLTLPTGYAGLSYSAYNSDYGTVAEPDVRIRMKSERWDLAGEKRELPGFISKLKVRLSHTDYQHREVQAGTVATTFRNTGNEGQLEATHAKVGNVSGAFGFQFHDSTFNAVGEEALLPLVRTESRAGYLYEEMALGKHKLTFGGRLERVRLRSDGGGPDDPNLAPGTPRFGPAQERSFTPRSFAAGALVSLAPSYTLAGNLSHTERAPSYNELFANGPHAATGQWEVGDANLKSDKSNGIDLQLRWREGAHSASVGAFHTRFSNFNTLFNSGRFRDDTGLLAASGTPEAQIRGVPAQFSGLEGEAKLHVYEGIGDLDLKLKGDYVRASNRETGEPLPRIAPYRVGFGLDYRFERFGALLDVTYAGKQNRVAANELPTDAYTMVNASFTYKLKEAAPKAELFARVNNLLNEEARVHTSFLKDVAPLGGRSLVVGVRGSF